MKSDSKYVLLLWYWFCVAWTSVRVCVCVMFLLLLFSKWSNQNIRHVLFILCLSHITLIWTLWKRGHFLFWLSKYVLCDVVNVHFGFIVGYLCCISVSMDSIIVVVNILFLFACIVICCNFVQCSVIECTSLCKRTFWNRHSISSIDTEVPLDLILPYFPAT